MRQPPPALDSKEKCEALFLQGGRTVRGVGRLARCDRRTAAYWLDEYAIPREHSHRVSRDRVRNPDWTPEPIFPDRREFPDEKKPTRDAVIAWQEECRKWELQQDVATVEIDTELPIGICHRGDWHYGSERTDYKTFYAHQELIVATPGLYTFENGDLHDHYIQGSKMGGVHEALMRPRTQRHFVWDALKQLKGRVLGLTKGQHEAWAGAQADFDPVEWVAHDYEIPYLGHGGLIRLRVGKAWYTLHIRHKARFNSAYNPTHSIKQTWRFYQDSDIGVHADKHTPAVELVEWKGAVRVAIRPGSYKPADDFSEGIGFGQSRPIMPVTILYPNERRVDAHWGLEWGADALGRARQPMSRVRK